MPSSAKEYVAPPATLDLTLAFPSALRPAVAALTAADAWHPATRHYFYQVMLGGETLSIPSRVYFDPRLLWDDTGRSAEQRGFAWCLGTRHHNGYVREACVARLLAAPQGWMAPFIVHLVGEYVDQIVQRIDAALPVFAPEMRAALAGFVRDNARYLDTIERRTISYRPYPLPASENYAGKRVVASLRALGRDIGTP